MWSAPETGRAGRNSEDRDRVTRPLRRLSRLAGCAREGAAYDEESFVAPRHDFRAARRRLIAALALSIAVPLIGAIAYACLTYERTLEERQATLDRLAGIAEGRVEHILDSNCELVERVEELLADADEPSIRRNEATLHARLAALASHRAYVHALSVVGRDGAILAMSRETPVPAVSIGDRDDFRSARDARAMLRVDTGARPPARRGYRQRTDSAQGPGRPLHRRDRRVAAARRAAAVLSADPCAQSGTRARPLSRGRRHSRTRADAQARESAAAACRACRCFRAGAARRLSAGHVADGRRRQHDGLQARRALSALRLRQLSDAPKIVWRLPFKMDGIGYTLDSEIHLFNIDATTGASTQLTKGSFEVDSAEWSPDCSTIAYTRTREGRFAHRTDLWLVDRTGEHARQVTHDVATCSYPHWSPDGRFVARRGRQEIASISVPHGHVTRVVTGDRQIDAFCRHKRGLVFASDTGIAPKDVWTCDPDGQDEHRLTDFNAWWRDRTPIRIDMRRFEVRTVTAVTSSSKDGCSGPSVRRNMDRCSSMRMAARRAMPSSLSTGMSTGMRLPRKDVGSRSQFGRFERLWKSLQFARKKALGKMRSRSATGSRRRAAQRRTSGRTHKSYGGLRRVSERLGHRQHHRIPGCRRVRPGHEHRESLWRIGQRILRRHLFDVGNLSVKRDAMRELSPLSYVERVVTPTLILQGEADERCPVCRPRNCSPASWRRRRRRRR